MRDFTKMWLGESVSVLGDQLSLVALPSLAILTLQASAEQVGFLNAITTVSFPVCAMFIGAVMDRVRCRIFMIVADLVRLTAFGAIAAFALVSWLSLRELYIAAAVAGVCTVLFDISYQTHLPRLVSQDFLVVGNARLEGSYSLARSSGPALSGVLIQLLGPAPAVAMNAASFLASAVGLVSIRKPETVPPRRDHGRIIHDLSAGMGYLWRHPCLRMLSGAALVRNFGIAMIDTLLLVFVYRGLHWPPILVGVVLAMGALGAIVGAWGARRLLGRVGLSRTLLATTIEGVVWLVLPVALLGFAPVVIASIEFVSAMWLPVWNITVLTFRQLETPPYLLGRVHAASRTINLATTPFGALVGGVVATWTSHALGERLGLCVALVLAGICASNSLVFLLQRDVRGHSTTLRTPTWRKATAETGGAVGS